MNSLEAEQNKRSDGELIVMCTRGDRHAFRLLMETHQGYAYALAFRILRDEDSAKDAVQESFVQVWKHLSSYQKEIKFTTWLYKIVVHRCYDAMKMKSRQHSLFRFISDFFDADAPADTNDMHTQLEHRDFRKHILLSAEKLPPKQRLVFVLRDIQDFTLDEIAEYTGISVGTVKTHLCYARKRIRLDLMRLQESEQS